MAVDGQREGRAVDPDGFVRPHWLKPIGRVFAVGTLPATPVLLYYFIFY